MTLLLSNEDVASVLEMGECLAVLERAYRALGERRALYRPRTDMYMPGLTPTSSYVFKTMEGAYPDDEVVALRICSDTIAWSDYEGVVRKDKPPTPDGYWIGIVLLFSTRTRKPIAILPDGEMQRFRVGATNALGARHLSRPDAHVYALFGTGWQASAQLMAMSRVRQLSEVRVYSPNPDHRRTFAEHWGEQLGLPIHPAGSGEEAARGAHIVGCATSAASAVLQPEWIEPGMHLSCIKRSELGARVLARCQKVGVFIREGSPHNYLTGVGQHMVLSHDPIAIVQKTRTGEPVTPEDLELHGRQPDAYPGEPELCELVTGQAVGQESPEQTTAFINNIGMGLQFAALGGLIYRCAKERGLGQELPTEWFLERVPC